MLDPACGTGTFLYKTIGLIRERFGESGNVGMWSSYVHQHLLPRIFGFELLMAPYAVAHLKLGMELAAMDLDETLRRHWAYDFSSDERLGVYLTNTLDEAAKQAERLTLGGYISDEANETAAIKRDDPVMLVLGNPPYSGHSANKGTWEIIRAGTEWPAPVADYSAPGGYGAIEIYNADNTTHEYLIGNYPAPDHSTWLVITAVQGNVLRLKSDKTASLGFDMATDTFTS